MDYDDVEQLNSNSKKVIEFLKNKYGNLNGLKTRLSALFVLTENQDFHIDMMENIKKYNTEVNKQEKNQNQKDNWITTEEIETIYDKLKMSVKPLWEKKDLTTKELLQIQDFVILSLYTLIAPRRCLDYTEFKINNIDVKKR